MTGPSDRPIIRLRRVICQHLYIPDEDLDFIDVLFAAFCSHRIEGDPLWLLFIDASGGGKTELLRSLRNRGEAYFLSTLTEKSLKSGYRDPKHPSVDPSLLPKLNEKVLIIKDLSPILSMRRDSRNVILGELREAYDGFSDDAKGNIGKTSYSSRFSLIAAATLTVDRFVAVEQELGERFVKFRAHGDYSRLKVRRAIGGTAHDTGRRTEMAAAVEDFFGSLPAEMPHHIADGLTESLIIVADFVAKARSHVPRDRNHNLLYRPRPEYGTRLGKELAKLLLSLAYVRGKQEPDSTDLATVTRVAWDCIPPNRIEALRAIVGRRPSDLPEQTFRDAKADLTVLGILDSQGAFTEHWLDSLATAANLLKDPTLQERATSGVSAVLEELTEGAYRVPPDTARGQEGGAAGGSEGQEKA